MPSKEICPKCGTEFVASAQTLGTSVYMYRGTGEDKMRAISDGQLCSPCVSKITEGWKYPMDFKPMPKKTR